MSEIIPTVGRIVLYTVTAREADEINRRRQDARDQMDWHRANKTGAQVHVGNDAKEGSVYPMVIVAVWGITPYALVNGKAFLDGTDDFWVTSAKAGTGAGFYQWMPYQKAVAAGEIAPTLHT